jgi:2-polyprenyl-3-methyl-5-hydroxy-6-metoxy-1,4-benzoquinol methylase/tRNA A-37 threonylcarbamoyl transferase component Bud32
MEMRNEMTINDLVEEHMIDGLCFGSLKFNSRKQILLGIDAAKTYFLKIQIVKNINKNNDIFQEYQIMKHLNNRGCVTCPIALQHGKISRSYVYNLCEEKSILDAVEDDFFEYIVEQFIPSENGYNLSDVILTLLEQQSLGVYHADIKPDNIRFHNDICYFIDYDQSILLDQEVMSYDISSFIRFCSLHYSNKYCSGKQNSFLSRIENHENLNSLFVSGALDLGNTSVFRSQRTTNSPSGIYQNICEKNICANGTRLLDRRIDLLNSVIFKTGEKVLDVGCNFGMLSCYLYNRGCCVTGIDNDPAVIRAAKIISNILRKDVDYRCLDIDCVEHIGSYDTIMLFSVLHHTRNIKLNALKIIKSCNRVIFEVRLRETGKQFVDGVWTEVNEWNFDSLEFLINYLESRFAGFKLHKILGISDKNRHVLEFNKMEAGG